ncbi:membrane protein [Mycobacterium lepromatosis]|nr:membrane protein [Mycobacterium lepromatosis]
MLDESVAQIPNSGPNTFTLAGVTDQSNDEHWRRPGECPEPIPGRPTSASLVDPEDDLAPVRYPGNFGTTTAISYSDSDHLGDFGGTGYNVLDQQEALPYVQPQPLARHSVAEPTAIDSGQDNEWLHTVGQRGTQHLGLLVLRVGLGVVLAAHGLQKLFGWWGGQGLIGFKNSLTEVGYQHADVLAYVSAGGEVFAGVLLVLGLFAPVVAAGALAFLVNGLLAAIAAWPHSRLFPFFLPDGNEYQITLIVMTVTVILCGPGRYGLDAGRRWAYRPFVGSFIALLAGIAAGIVVWMLLNGVNPLD